MTRVSDERPKQKLKTDVLVVGGGAAGLAAACTAAKAGARVLLLEKHGFCGGAAVAGLSGTVCGLYAATDDRSATPEKIVFGFADRFLDVMKERGGITDPLRYGKTFTLAHDPLVWREAGDYLLEDAGAEVLFHTTVVDALNDGGHVDGVSAWTKQGRVEITASITVDASGDADVAALAGFEVMRTDAGFHADQTRWHVGKACFNLATRPLLTQHDRTAAIEADDVERVLANIDTDYSDGVVEIVRHSVLLVPGAPCQLQSLAGQEHGRTIPLAELRLVPLHSGFDRLNRRSK
jgi:FAD dependent oxidoreductase